MCTGASGVLARRKGGCGGGRSERVVMYKFSILDSPRGHIEEDIPPLCTRLTVFPPQWTRSGMSKVETGVSPGPGLVLTARARRAGQSGPGPIVAAVIYGGRPRARSMLGLLVPFTAC